jgi:hypothetical protein
VQVDEGGATPPPPSTAHPPVPPFTLVYEPYEPEPLHCAPGFLADWLILDKCPVSSQPIHIYTIGCRRPTNRYGPRDPSSTTLRSIQWNFPGRAVRTREGVSGYQRTLRTSKVTLHLTVGCLSRASNRPIHFYTTRCRSPTEPSRTVTNHTTPDLRPYLRSI